MKNIIHIFVVTVLAVLFSACQGGLEPLALGVDSGPLNTQLGAEVWHLNDQYKSVVDWEAIDAAQFYRLYWAGDIQLQDLGRVADLTTPEELEEMIGSLGYDVSTGINDIASDTTTHEHLGLNTGVGYCYVVTGIAGGEGDAEGVGHSNIDCVVPLAVPPVTAQAGSGEVAVSWEPVPGAAKYYVWRSEYIASPSVSKRVNLSKQVPPATVCAGLPLEVSVGETSSTSLLDDNNGEGLSNCPVYCYTVIPEDIEGNIMQGETQWDVALPEPDGTIENVWVFNSLSGPFYGVAVTANEEIIVSHDSGLVIMYSWDGSMIWQTDLKQTHDIFRTSALELDGDSVLVAVTLGTNVFNSVPGVCRLSVNNGALDPAFGTGGCAGAAIGPAFVSDVAVQSDGKVLISANEVAIAELYTYAYACRFLANGDLDLDFAKGKEGGGCYARLSDVGHLIAANGITAYTDGGEERSALVGRRETETGGKGLIVLLDNDGQELGVDDSSVSGQFYSATKAADGSLITTGTTSFGGNGIVVDFGASPLSIIDQVTYTNWIEGLNIGTDCRGKPVIGGQFAGDFANVAGASRIGDLNDLTSLLKDVGFGTAGDLVLHPHLGAMDETYGFAYSPVTGNYVFVGVLDALEPWKPFIATVR